MSYNWCPKFLLARFGLWIGLCGLLFWGTNEAGAQHPDAASAQRIDPVVAYTADAAEVLSTHDASSQVAGGLVQSEDALPDTLEVHPLRMGYSEMLREYGRMRHIPDAKDTATTDDPDSGIERLEIDGLVVDETQTRLGRAFYETFYRRWDAPPDAFNFTVTVQEQPVPNLGTRVTVRANGEIAYQTHLQPREELVQDAARQAVYYVRYHLENGAESARKY